MKSTESNKVKIKVELKKLNSKMRINLCRRKEKLNERRGSRGELTS